MSLLNESLLDVRTKNASNLSDEQFAQILSYDPVLNGIDVKDIDVLTNSKENSSRWLIKQYNSGDLFNYQPEEIQNLLVNFSKLKNRKGILKSNDINSYHNINELAQEVATGLNNLTDKQKAKDLNKQAHKEKKELEKTAREVGKEYFNNSVKLLFDGDDWEVWTPLTFEGSKLLRRGAVWCTGGDDRTHYDRYTREGMLYVIINKENMKKKYQLFVPYIDYDARHGREFRDENNDEVSFRKFCNENPELLDFFLTQDIVLNSYPNLDDPDVDDEWSEDKEMEVEDEYHLRYIEDTYEIGFGYYLPWMTQECKYISSDDVEEIIKSGFFESGNFSGWDSDSYYINTYRTIDFVEYIQWDDTALNDLKDEYVDETGNNVELKEFLYTLFQTKGKPFDENINKWLDSKCNSNDWTKDVYNNISKWCFNDDMVDSIVSKLQMFGFDAEQASKAYNPKEENCLFYNTWNGDFLIRMDDCHSVEQFYNEFTDNGRKTYSEVCDKIVGQGLKLVNIEEDYTTNFGYYEEMEQHIEDAKDIYHLFH